MTGAAGVAAKPTGQGPNKTRCEVEGKNPSIEKPDTCVLV